MRVAARVTLSGATSAASDQGRANAPPKPGAKNWRSFPCRHICHSNLPNQRVFYDPPGALVEEVLEISNQLAHANYTRTDLRSLLQYFTRRIVAPSARSARPWTEVGGTTISAH